MKHKINSFLLSPAGGRSLRTKGILITLGVAILISSLLFVGLASVHVQSSHNTTAERGHTTSVRTQPLHTSSVYREDIFGVSPSFTLTHRVYQNGAVSAPEDLGGYVTSTPAAVAWTSSIGGSTGTVVSVFVRNANGGVSYRSFASGAWGSWGDLGGNILYAPAVTSAGTNSIKLVAIGTNHAVYLKSMWIDSFGNPVWTEWSNVGGYATSAPAVAFWGAGLLILLVRGADNALWSIDNRINDDDWSGWFSEGGTLTSAPAAVSWGSGVEDVFVRNTSGSPSYYYRSNTAAPYWTNEAGPAMTNFLAVASIESGSLDAFYQGADGSLFHRNYLGTKANGLTPQGAWDDWGGYSALGYAVAAW